MGVGINRELMRGEHTGWRDEHGAMEERCWIRWERGCFMWEGISC